MSTLNWFELEPKMWVSLYSDSLYQIQKNCFICYLYSYNVYKVQKGKRYSFLGEKTTLKGAKDLCVSHINKENLRKDKLLLRSF